MGQRKPASRAPTRSIGTVHPSGDGVNSGGCGRSVARRRSQKNQAELGFLGQVYNSLLQFAQANSIPGIEHVEEFEMPEGRKGPWVMSEQKKMGDKLAILQEKISSFAGDTSVIEGAMALVRLQSSRGLKDRMDDIGETDGGADNHGENAAVDGSLDTDTGEDDSVQVWLRKVGSDSDQTNAFLANAATHPSPPETASMGQQSPQNQTNNPFARLLGTQTTSDPFQRFLQSEPPVFKDQQVDACNPLTVGQIKSLVSKLDTPNDSHMKGTLRAIGTMRGYWLELQDIDATMLLGDHELQQALAEACGEDRPVRDSQTGEPSPKRQHSNPGAMSPQEMLQQRGLPEDGPTVEESPSRRWSARGAARPNPFTTPERRNKNFGSTTTTVLPSNSPGAGAGRMFQRLDNIRSCVCQPRNQDVANAVDQNANLGQMLIDQTALMAPLATAVKMEVTSPSANDTTMPLQQDADGAATANVQSDHEIEENHSLSAATGNLLHTPTKATVNYVAAQTWFPMPFNNHGRMNVGASSGPTSGVEEGVLGVAGDVQPPQQQPQQQLEPWDEFDQALQEGMTNGLGYQKRNEGKGEQPVPLDNDAPPSPSLDMGERDATSSSESNIVEDQAKSGQDGGFNNIAQTEADALGLHLVHWSTIEDWENIPSDVYVDFEGADLGAAMDMDWDQLMMDRDNHMMGSDGTLHYVLPPPQQQPKQKPERWDEFDQELWDQLMMDRDNGMMGSDGTLPDLFPTTATSSSAAISSSWLL